jgi:hypothetical protein
MRPAGCTFAHALIAASVFAEANPLPAPHPQITEVFFNVPTGPAGDANKDGVRDAAGDEFIEIANPHDQPINLAGYVLANRRGALSEGKSVGVRFVFPDVELPAHSVAVVFNGYLAKLPPPFGTKDTAPKEPSKAFGGALVFTMDVTSKTTALANNGDWVLLSAPDGTALDCVSWGEPDPPPPEAALRKQVVAPAAVSVQRLQPDEPLEPHTQINAQVCSPGVIPARTKPASRITDEPAAPEPPESKPAGEGKPRRGR